MHEFWSVRPLRERIDSALCERTMIPEYITKYVPKKLLEEKLITSIKNVKIMLEQRNKNSNGIT